jgi:hypothetical protein
VDSHLAGAKPSAGWGIKSTDALGVAGPVKDWWSTSNGSGAKWSFQRGTWDVPMGVDTKQYDVAKLERTIPIVSKWALPQKVSATWTLKEDLLSVRKHVEVLYLYHEGPSENQHATSLLASSRYSSAKSGE